MTRGRRWRPKIKVVCRKCGWKGRRVIVAKVCPKCGTWYPERDRSSIR